jgi:hypothetical protein
MADHLFRQSLGGRSAVALAALTFMLVVPIRAQAASLTPGVPNQVPPLVPAGAQAAVAGALAHTGGVPSAGDGAAVPAPGSVPSVSPTPVPAVSHPGSGAPTDASVAAVRSVSQPPAIPPAAQAQISQAQSRLGPRADPSVATASRPAAGVTSRPRPAMALAPSIAGRAATRPTARLAARPRARRAGRRAGRPGGRRGGRAHARRPVAMAASFASGASWLPASAEVAGARDRQRSTERPRRDAARGAGPGSRARPRLRLANTSAVASLPVSPPASTFLPPAGADGISAGGAGGAAGATAAALLALVGVYALSALLPGLLSLGLSRWRSALLACRLERPG